MLWLFVLDSIKAKQLPLIAEAVLEFDQHRHYAADALRYFT